MAITLAFTGVVKSQGPAVGSGVNDQTNGELILDFLATLTGNYTAGGDPLDFTSAAPEGYALPPVPPSWVEVQELGVIGTAVPGYQYQYVYGPTLAAPTPMGGALQVFGAGAASGDGGTEFSAGPYSSGTPSLNNKQLKVRAHFAKAA